MATALLYERLLRDDLPRDTEPRLSPAGVVALHWGALLGTLSETSYVASGLPAKAARVATFLVSRCAPLAQLLSREPALRTAVVAAVEAGLREGAARGELVLPAWVVRLGL